MPSSVLCYDRRRKFGTEGAKLREPVNRQDTPPVVPRIPLHSDNTMMNPLRARWLVSSGAVPYSGPGGALLQSEVKGSIAVPNRRAGRPSIGTQRPTDAEARVGGY